LALALTVARCIDDQYARQFHRVCDWRLSGYSGISFE
jgi:hypothetical protein